MTKADGDEEKDELLPVVQPEEGYPVAKADEVAPPKAEPRKKREEHRSPSSAGSKDAGGREKEKDDDPKPGESKPSHKAAPKRKKKSLLRRLIPFLILAALGAAGYFVWAASREEGFGPGFAGGNGRLEATEIDLATKLAGRIEEIHVDEGDMVEAGQELAVMQLNVLMAQRNQAWAELVKARAAVESARAQIAVRISDVSAAKATVAQRESELDQTQRRLERSEVLSQKGVITGQQYDDDETSEMAAQAAVGTARAQVAVAEAAVSAARADAEGALAAVKAAEASVATIDADIADSHLVAPRSGRVQYRIVQPGEVVAAGGRVLNFVDLSDVYMNFFLSSEGAGQVPIGSEARIVLDAFPDVAIPARITYVAQTAQFTPKTVETRDERAKLMFRIKAKVDPEFLRENLDTVKPGLPGMAWIRLDETEPWPEELNLDPPRRLGRSGKRVNATGARTGSAR